jgi:hypothetical protein
MSRPSRPFPVSRGRRQRPANAIIVKNSGTWKLNAGDYELMRICAGIIFIRNPTYHHIKCPYWLNLYESIVGRFFIEFGEPENQPVERSYKFSKQHSKKIRKLSTGTYSICCL